MGNKITGGALSASDSWLHLHRPNPTAAVRLFCLPYAGGTAAMYRSWPRTLPQTVEVCAVQLPGRGGRMHEPPYRRLKPLVRAMGSALLPALDKPFALFGHSMGALVAFELARHLRREHGLAPAHFFASGQSAPQYDDQFPPLHELPDAALLEEIRRLNGTPREVLEHPEVIRLILPMLRADFAICGTYEYEAAPPLDCPVTVFGGMQDKEFPLERLEEWRVQAGTSFAVHMLPGDHFFLRPSESQLLTIITAELRQMMARLHVAT